MLTQLQTTNQKQPAYAALRTGKQTSSKGALPAVAQAFVSAGKESRTIDALRRMLARGAYPAQSHPAQHHRAMLRTLSFPSARHRQAWALSRGVVVWKSNSDTGSIVWCDGAGWVADATG